MTDGNLFQAYEYLNYFEISHIYEVYKYNEYELYFKIDLILSHILFSS